MFNELMNKVVGPISDNLDSKRTYNYFKGVLNKIHTEGKYWSSIKHKVMVY